MGIKGLNQLLRNRCPTVFEKIHITEYAYQKIAVDTSLYMYKFKASVGDRWLLAFLKFVGCLRKHEIHCVFLYDSGCVKEKLGERAVRAAARAKIEEKVREYEDALVDFDTTGEVAGCLEELHAKAVKGTRRPRFLGTTSSVPNVGVDMDLVRREVERKQKTLVKISSEDFALTKELFDILRVPWYDAPLEAETICADMCKQGLVAGVLSEDTDVLAYGSPVLISTLDSASGVCTRVCHGQILQELELTVDSFLDLCIMSGTDYNKNIPQIGPERACNLIQKYGDIDAIRENTAMDVDVLNHARGRDIFKNYERMNGAVPYCGQPDWEALKEFVSEHDLAMDVDTLHDSFVHAVLEFPDETKKSPDR
jgi:5'-3' exonuclease